jgi:hypothetical protein
VALAGLDWAVWGYMAAWWTGCLPACLVALSGDLCRAVNSGRHETRGSHETRGQLWTGWTGHGADGVSHETKGSHSGLGCRV